jgi:hypothetical protein
MYKTGSLSALLGRWALAAMLLAFIPALVLLSPGKGMTQQTPSPDDLRKASEQATQVAKKKAEQDEKDRKAKEKITREIVVNKDDKAGSMVTDNKMQWVRHQDFFGIQGIEGDLALQFRIDSKKVNGQWTPTNTTMIVSIYSTSEAHKDNNGGTITVDDKPITFDSTTNYHTDNPLGVFKKGDRIEVMDFPITYDQFTTIASGKKIKGKMAGIEFEVKDLPLSVFKEMMMETLPLPTAAAPTAQ